MTKPDKTFILEFLTQEELNNNLNSNLMVAINDVRKICGRNKNGEIKEVGLTNENEYLNPNSIIVITTYFTILDLIGTIFKIKTYTEKASNNIKNALSQFSTLNTKEINILVSLRNSITHNFSLVGFDRKDNPKNKYHFTLEHFSSGKIIEQKDKWNGDKSSKNELNTTIVRTKEFIDLVENIYKKVIAELKNDNISIKLDITEIKSRFTFKH